MLSTNTVSLQDLEQLLNHTPLIVSSHPVSLCFLREDVLVLDSAAEVAWLLDDPEPTLPQRVLITSPDPAYRGRFPRFRCEHDPFTPLLNTVLFHRFDDVADHMLRQSQITERILSEAAQFNVIVLFLVDGLSYRDARDWADTSSQTPTIEPCLVDVPTLTATAFPNLIGDPPLAARLFDLGYHRRLGFTYWTREDNQLTDQLFHAIPDVRKVAGFPRILESLRRQLANAHEPKIYVQILRTGLDGYAHGQKRKPPVAAVIADVREELQSLVTLCGDLGLRACVHLTADHGILWRDEFEPEIVGNAPGKSGLRWCGWRSLYHQRDKGRRFTVGDQEYYCLGFPKLRRSLHIDEQGIHGGISFQESIVPFISIRIENPC